MNLEKFFMVFQCLLTAISSFQISQKTQSAKMVESGDTVTLVCKSDSHYEYCSWSHNKRKCDFEWKYAHGKVLKQECHDDLRHRVTMRGNYDNHECGLEIKNFDAEKDIGMWKCEMEKYVMLGKKGSGDRATMNFYVGALTTTTTTTTARPSTSVDPTPLETSARTEEPFGGGTESGWVINLETSTTTEEPIQDPHYEYEHLEDSFEDYSIEYDHEDNSTEIVDSLDDSDVQSRISEDAPVSVEDGGQGVVGIVCGVLVAVLATTAVVTGAVLWRRKKRREGVITMSKILEDTEARGAILEETEYHATSSIMTES